MKNTSKIPLVVQGVLIDHLGEIAFVRQDELLHLPAGVKPDLYLVPVQVYGIKPTGTKLYIRRRKIST